MKGRIAVLFMSGLLVLYLVLVLQLAIRLIAVDTGPSQNGIARVLGVALIVLPLLGAWALVAEIVFGVRTQRLVRRLDAAGELPVDTLPHRTSGRPERAAADAEFPRYKAEVEANPSSWKAWFRLGLSYDASGDRSRARRSLRKAISLERAAR